MVGTMIGIDRSKPVRQPADLVSLARAVLNAGPNDENDALEWKGRLDLKVANGLAHVVRAILGFGNRDPAVAARFFDGYAYLLVGVEPGNLCGVEEMDLAALDQKTRPYLGDASRRWTGHWLHVDDRSVLAVVVDPPRPGDPSWALRKEIQLDNTALRSGTVFVRHKASTEPQSASDHDMLHRRLLAGRNQVKLSVEWCGSPPVLPALDLSDDAIERWVYDERERQLASLAPTPSPTGGPFDRVVANMSVTALAGLGRLGDERSPTDFRNEVERYLESASGALPGEMCLALVDKYQPFGLELHNLTERNFTRVEAKIHITGDVVGMDLDDLDRDTFLPAPPQAFGQPRDWGPILPTQLLAPLNPPNPRIGPQIDNSRSVHVRFPVVDLRPRDRIPLDPLFVVARETLVGEPITVEWSATATNADGLARGSLSAVVADSAHDPISLLSEPHSE